MMIRPFDQRDMPDVETLSLLAWEPVFHSFEQVLGTEIYLRIYPDWKTAQRTAVKEMCEDVKTETWVTEADGAPAGFIVWELNRQTLEGEVHMLAVHPKFQHRGIGAELNDFAIKRFREEGMTLAVVGTGGDPGHAPARRSYEKAGYTGLPLMRYYRPL